LPCARWAFLPDVPGRERLGQAGCYCCCNSRLPTAVAGIVVASQVLACPEATSAVPAPAAFLGPLACELRANVPRQDSSA
jgi:hypothetical protein